MYRLVGALGVFGLALGVGGGCSKRPKSGLRPVSQQTKDGRQLFVLSSEVEQERGAGAEFREGTIILVAYGVAGK
jgi:hypothetical protein